MLATPTGSTGYALSSGGPVVVPESNSIVIVPVAPHSLSVRPIVICDNVEIKMNVMSRTGHFLVAVDGRNSSCSEEDCITIRRAPYDIKNNTLRKQNFLRHHARKTDVGRRPAEIITQQMNFGGKEYKFAVILPWIGKVVRHYKLKMCLNVVLGWTVVGLNFLFVWTTKNAIDMATVYHNQWALRFACAMLVVIIILQAVISAINRRLKTLLSFNMNRRMQEHLFHHAVSANWKDINEYHTGDIVRRFEEDGTEIISFVNGTIPTILLVLLQLGGAYVFLFVLSKDIAIALAVIMVLGIVISKFHFLKIRSFSAKIKECGSRLQAALQEGVQNISVLKALTGAEPVCQILLGHFRHTERQHQKRRLTYSVLSLPRC